MRLALIVLVSMLLRLLVIIPIRIILIIIVFNYSEKNMIIYLLSYLSFYKFERVLKALFLSASKDVST